MPETRKKIALFLGSDIVAHLIMNKIVPQILQAGYEPVLFFPKHHASSKADLPELKTMAFLERHLLKETVYPFLDQDRLRNLPNYSPNRLATKYGLHIEEVANVNDPAFVNEIATMKGLVGALSIRCFQIFKPPIINAIKNVGFFANMHPGLLPEFRGVYSTARTMASNSPEFGITLHVVDPGIDTGDIYYMGRKPLDRNKTVYRTNFELAALGAQKINTLIGDLQAGNAFDRRPQTEDGSVGAYYSYPNAEELKSWKQKGVRLYDPAEIAEMLSNVFTQPDTYTGNLLEAEINKAIALHFQKATVANDPGVPSANANVSTGTNGGTTAFQAQRILPEKPRGTFGRRRPLLGWPRVHV